MPKITFIGAGSVIFAKNLMLDILSVSELRESTITLMDIDPHRLKLIEKLGRRIVEEKDYPTIIEATTDRQKALKNADYVISMIQVGGLDAYAYDIEIPRKYGVNQAVGDTLGPGGVFRGLRTIHVYQEIIRDMEELCPEALFINYVNPMAINTWALNKISDIKTIGLCHSVQGTAEALASRLEIPVEEMNYRAAGINHMAWFLELEHKGKDLYPEIKEMYNNPDIYRRDVTKFEFLKYFGYFVTESSIHMSEYVPYFRNNKEWTHKIHDIQNDYEIGWTTDDESGVYLMWCREMAKRFDDQIQKLMEEDLNIKRTHEYGSFIIEAMETGRPQVIHGNIINKSLITNLPEGCVVELPCLVDRNGIQPTRIGDLPTQLAALNRTNINVQELAVEGSLSGNKEAIYQAVMMDPLTSSTLTMPEIHKMVSEMFEVQAEYLPQFK